MVRQAGYAKKQPENPKLKALLASNLFLKEFPDGFMDYEDLYKAAQLLEEKRTKKPKIN